MKALVFHGNNDLRYEDVFYAPPGPGEVKIRVKAAGVCGSDVHGYLGITGRRLPPMVMGHEFAGVVEQLGPGVEMVKAGDRVAVFPFGFDGTCPTCMAGNFTMCETRVLYGVLSDNGAFADYVNVRVGACIKLDDSVSFEEGCMIEPLTVAYHAVTHLRDEDLAGKAVFVVGAGTIGQLTIACVAMKKPSMLIVSDLSDARLAVAKKMGATHTVNPASADAVETVRSLAGGKGADAAFEAVGASVTVRQAMSALRNYGKAVWIGNSQKIVEVNMQEVVTRELSIFGTNAFSLGTFMTTAELINTRQIDVTPLISHVAPMRDGPALFAKLAKDPGDWIKVVLTN